MKKKIIDIGYVLAGFVLLTLAAVFIRGCIIYVWIKRRLNNGRK